MGNAKLEAKLEYLASAEGNGADQYIEDNVEIFQKHLYRYLLDYTNEKARAEVLANKDPGVLETYRAILHRGLNISDERRLDVEATVFNHLFTMLLLRNYDFLGIPRT